MKPIKTISDLANTGWPIARGKLNEILDNTETLMDNVNKFTQSTANTKGFKIVFIDDDGNEAFETNIQPSFDARGLKCDLAVNMKFVDDGVTPNKLTGAKLQALQAAGYGILNHGWDHTGLQTLTEAQIVANYALEKAKFESLSLTGYDKLVYPGVMTGGNLTLKNLLRKLDLYKCNACNVSAPRNTWPLDMFEIQRQGFPTNSGEYTTAKAYVDKCYSDGSLAVFFQHSYNVTDPTYLNQLLDYIVAQGWTITPFATVIDQFTEVIGLGNKSGSHFIMDSNGNVSHGDGNVQMKTYVTETDTSQYTMNQYPDDSITHTLLEADAGRVGMPGTGRSTLITTKYHDTYNRQYQTIQEWRGYTAVTSSRRRWDYSANAGAGGWTAWV